MLLRLLIGLIFLGILGFPALSQKDSDAEEVLRMIQELQVQSDEFYDPGLFPSKRHWFNSTDPVEDNNVFVTASLAYILRALIDRVDAQSAVVIKDMLAKAEKNYDKYYSRRGVPTYNFWQTIPPDLPFPNGGSLLSKESYRLPDDYDDTSLIRLASDPDSTKDLEIRNKMVSYANRPNRKTIENTLKKYKDHIAYEVFYVDKMDQEYDVVVMCNVLMFVLDRGYTLEPIDLKTVDFIKQVISENDHWEHPEAISRSYRSTVWILYHVARLISLNSELFVDIKEQVLADLKKLAETELADIEQVLVHSSLLRLGVNPGKLITLEQVKKELDSFVFFHAQLTNFNWVPTMKWRSKAFNLTLFYEYLILRQK